MARKSTYDNESISSLKGADRVRKRPGVIFGSDGLEGCEHAVFEILSNAIDEARGGHGKLITVTRFADRSIQVEDQRELRVLPGSERPWLLRHPVRLPVHGRDRVAGRQGVPPAL